MRSVILGLASAGGLGAYVLTGHGVGQSVERIVDRSPAATYASFEESLKPLSRMDPKETAFSRYGEGAMKFGYTSQPGKHITLSLFVNGAEMADMEFDFAPDEQSKRTKLTVTMAPGKSAPPQMQLALALGDKKVFEKMVDETVRRVELGLPVAPEFTRLGMSQDAIARGESSYKARNPDYKVMEQDYARQRAQEAAAAPSSDAGKPMLDPSRSRY